MEKAITKKTKRESSIELHGVGRRKSSVARVWLKRGKGNVQINGKDFTEYFDTDLSRSKIVFPFKSLNIDKSYDAQVNVYGGGLKSQAEAVRLGISRALLKVDSAFRSVLKRNGLLTVDSRLKERKKYGQKAARRKFQFVKR